MTTDREERYRLLLDLSQRIGPTFDLQEILGHLLTSVRLAVDYDAAGVFVLSEAVRRDPERGGPMIAAMAAVGFSPDPNREDPMLRSGKGIIGHVIRTGETVTVPDVRLDSHYVAGRAPTLSEVAVPIWSGGRVIGALNLESDRLGAYVAEHAQMLASFATAAAIFIDKAILHHQVLDKQRLERQLALAREVQTSLLPAESPQVPGYDIAGINLPTMEIGGDYFDYIPLGRDRLGLVVADVSGKGVPAALIMATFRAALRSELRRERVIADVVDSVNRLLIDSKDTSRYVTAVYGILDAGSGTFTYVNCGQTPPILLKAGGETEWLDQGGPALGMPVAGQRETASVKLGTGDVLALYTDGVVEVFSESGDEFGVARLEQVIRAAGPARASHIIRAVVDATQSHAGRLAYDDDFTLAVVRKLPGLGA
jgi:sigma-B regulation protein RsbU (phosphoserine phosphatase)